MMLFFKEGTIDKETESIIVERSKKGTRAKGETRFVFFFSAREKFFVNLKAILL